MMLIDVLPGTGEPTTKNYSAQNVNGAEVEKPWYKPVRLNNNGHFYLNPVDMVPFRIVFLKKIQLNFIWPKAP